MVSYSGRRRARCWRCICRIRRWRWPGGKRERAVAGGEALLKSGVYVNLALPPATPNGASLLRCSVCAAHSRHQLERVIDTITEVAYQIGVLSEPARAAG